MNIAKRLMLIVAFLGAAGMSMAQDVIVKKDGTTIQSKVEEINSTDIKYKKWSNLDGPFYTISKSEVVVINYQNGEIEVIQSNSTGSANSNASFALNGIMERDGRDLTLNGRELNEEEVLQLVGEENYQTYLGARKQIAVGRAFTPLFYVSAAATIAFVIASYEDNVYSIPATLCGVVADVSFPMMIVFNAIGKRRLNWVADDYNKNHGNLSYDLSPTIMKCNAPGIQNNVGVGMAFTLNF